MKMRFAFALVLSLLFGGQAYAATASMSGTSVEVAFTTATTTPSGIDLNIPAGTTAVYFFWQYWTNSDGSGIASVTLETVSYDQLFEINNLVEDAAAGVAVWYNPTTGAGQTLLPVWDIAPGEGPVGVVAFVQDGNTTAWTDADADSGTGGGATSVTLTSATDEFVIAFDAQYSGLPAAMGGSWTSELSLTGNGSRNGRLSSITATGSTQAASSQATINYSSIVAVSIPPAAGGGGATIPITLQQLDKAYGPQRSQQLGGLLQ